MWFLIKQFYSAKKKEKKRKKRRKEWKDKKEKQNGMFKSLTLLLDIQGNWR